MKAACIILTIIIVVAIVAVICMVKFATEITVEERRRELLSSGVYKYSRNLGVIALNDNQSMTISERFPYVAAITRNNSGSWSFTCFGAIILLKWLVTAAHCRKPGYTHRVLLFYEFARNYTHTYPILFWRIHEKFNANSTIPMYDIAVAKLNIDQNVFSTRPAIFDEKSARYIEASVWKTVTTMDKKMYLTNDFDKFDVAIADSSKCYEGFAIDIDDSMICLDMSNHNDCFITEFGPIFSNDRVIGVLAIKPRDCDVKMAIFTNVSFYSDWILKTTHTTFYG